MQNRRRITNAALVALVLTLVQATGTGAQEENRPGELVERAYHGPGAQGGWGVVVPERVAPDVRPAAASIGSYYGLP